MITNGLCAKTVLPLSNNGKGRGWKRRTDGKRSTNVSALTRSQWPNEPALNALELDLDLYAMIISHPTRTNELISNSFMISCFPLHLLLQSPLAHAQLPSLTPDLLAHGHPPSLIPIFVYLFPSLMILVQFHLPPFLTACRVLCSQSRMKTSYFEITALSPADPQGSLRWNA